MKSAYEHNKKHKHRLEIAPENILQIPLNARCKGAR